MEGVPRAALFLAMGGKCKCMWPLFLFLQGPRTS